MQSYRFFVFRYMFTTPKTFPHRNLKVLMIYKAYIPVKGVYARCFQDSSLVGYSAKQIDTVTNDSRSSLPPSSEKSMSQSPIADKNMKKGSSSETSATIHHVLHDVIYQKTRTLVDTAAF